MPVRDLLARYPHLASALAARGFDACCGGIHPLAQACEARGVALDDVLRDLASAHAAAEAHAIIPPTMSVRDIRRRYPSTIPVFAGWGLGDCGGGDGPDEPVAWFATVHRLALDELLGELREAAVRDAAAAPRAPDASAGASAAALPFSPHFILGSLFLTLTLGATTGMVNLLRIAAGGEVPLSHRQIHGHTQVLGFAALFLMGIAYHALPRILAVASRARGGPSPRIAFWLMFSGVIARNVGQPLGFYAAGRLVSLLSSLLEVSSGILFAIFVFSLLREGPDGKYGGRDPLRLFVRAGTLLFLAAMAFDAAQGVWLAGHADAGLPAALTEPFYASALYGFLLAWIYGFGNRVVSLFLGLKPAGVRPSVGTLALQTGGVALLVVSWAPGFSGKAALGLRDAGLALASLSAILFLASHGFPFRKASLPAPRVAGAPGFAIRAAFACLGLWALLELAGVAASRLTAIPAQNPWWADAARHTFTIGFLTLLIVGMSFRILPVFSGRRLWSPSLAFATYGLLLGGVALRLLQYPAAFRPVFYVIASYMGVPVVIAIALFAFNLVQTIRSAPSAATSSRPASPSRGNLLPVLPAR